MPRRQHASGCSQRDRGQTDRQTAVGQAAEMKAAPAFRAPWQRDTLSTGSRKQARTQSVFSACPCGVQGSGSCLLHIGKNDLRRTFQGDGTRTRKGKWIWFVLFPTWSKGSFLAFCQNSGLLKRCVQFAKPAHADQGFAEAAPVHCRKCGG